MDGKDVWGMESGNGKKRETLGLIGMSLSSYHVQFRSSPTLPSSVFRLVLLFFGILLFIYNFDLSYSRISEFYPNILQFSLFWYECNCISLLFQKLCNPGCVNKPELTHSLIRNFFSLLMFFYECSPLL